MSIKLHKITNKELLFRFIESKPNKRVTYSEMQKFLFERNNQGLQFDSHINRGYQSTNLVPGSGYMYKDVGYGKLVKLLNIENGKSTYTVVRPLGYKKTHRFKEEILSVNNKIEVMNKKTFKIGDKVIGNKLASDMYEISQEGFIGTVVSVNESLIQILDTDGNYKFWVDPQCFDLYEEPIKKASEVTYTVDADFIKLAHHAACSEWKKLLEDKFPDVFVKSSSLELAIKKFGRDTIYDGYKKVIAFGDHLFIPLPNSNTEWTMSAYEFAKDFITLNPSSYITHNAKYVFESLKKSSKFDETLHDDSLTNFLVVVFVKENN